MIANNAAINIVVSSSLPSPLPPGAMVLDTESTLKCYVETFDDKINTDTIYWS